MSLILTKLINFGAGLQNTAGALTVKIADFLNGGAAEIDADQLDIDFSPSNYTPATVGGVSDNVAELASHLKGIDAKLGAVPTTTPRVERFTLAAGDITAKYVTLAATPASAARVLLSIAGYPTQHYSDDYQMDGTNHDRLTWSGLGLEALLASGEKLTVAYDA